MAEISSRQAVVAPMTIAQSVNVTQNSHGLSLYTNDIPVPLYYQASNYNEAAGDSMNTAAQFFLIDVPDPNTLEFARSIAVTVPSHGFTVGKLLYLADAGKGIGGTAYTHVIGDSTNQQPMGIVASATQLLFQIEPAPLNAALLQDFRDEFTATTGQTVFTLTHAPSNPDATKMYVNAGKYDIVDDYTISGNVLTWLNTPFGLDAGDDIEIYYQY